MLTQKFVGSTVQGNDATLRVQAYMDNVDSAYLRVWARNITSNCTNFMDDTAIVFFRNFKNGPFVIKGSVFNGQYNSGDFFTPDAVKVGGVGRYQIVAPKGTTKSTISSETSFFLAHSRLTGIVAADDCVPRAVKYAGK